MKREYLVRTIDAEGTLKSLAVDTLDRSNTSLGTRTDELWILAGNWSLTKELHDSYVASEARYCLEQTLSSAEETAVLAKQTAT